MLTTSSKTERPMIEIYTKVGDICLRDFQTEIVVGADLGFQARGRSIRKKKGYPYSINKLSTKINIQNNYFLTR